MKNKKLMLILLVFAFIFVSVGISYAYFIFLGSGGKSEIIAGDIYMHFNDDNYIGLSGIVSLYSDTEARARTDNKVSFSIDGKNTSDKTIYYEIKLKHGEDVVGKSRIKDKVVKFDLVEVNGSTENMIVSAASFDNFDDQVLYIDTIPSNTNSYYKEFYLRMWISNDLLFSDTDPNADFCASAATCETGLPVASSSLSYTNMMVEVYGDLEEKHMNNYMGTFSSIITSHKTEVSKVKFIKEDVDAMERDYAAVTVKEDVTYSGTGNTLLDGISDYGKVYAWLEDDPDIENKYILKIASPGYIYLSTGEELFGATSSSDRWRMTEIDFGNVRTDYVTSMFKMFYRCQDLVGLDLSKFNTSNVTDMSYMFRMTGLEKIDISSFDTSNVDTLGNMFDYCQHLKEVDVSGFNTSNVTDMGYMFNECNELLYLDVSGFDTSKVIDMCSMFGCCYDLGNIDVSSFDTSLVEDFSYMFYACNNFTTLDLRSFNFSSATYMSYMFECDSRLESNLEYIYFDFLDFCARVEGLFRNCINLKRIYVMDAYSGISDNIVSYFQSSDMFTGCTSLVGGNGTVYDSSHTNALYANVDTSSTPGYFTLLS